MKCFVFCCLNAFVYLYFFKRDKIKEKFGILRNMAGLRCRTVKQKYVTEVVVHGRIDAE